MLSGRAVPEPRLDGLTVGLLRRAPEIGDGRATESSDAAEAWVAELERLGARVVEAAIPAARGDMWPLFLHEAAQSHRDTFPSRADEYGAGDPAEARARLSASTPTAVATRLRGAARVAALRARGRSLREPVHRASTCRAEDADELEVRLPLSSFLRWVNLIGWAGLAIGNMQFIAPDDETVLAAGLAWERR